MEDLNKQREVKKKLISDGKADFKRKVMKEDRKSDKKKSLI